MQSISSQPLARRTILLAVMMVLPALAWAEVNGESKSNQDEVSNQVADTLPEVNVKAVVTKSSLPSEQTKSYTVKETTSATRLESSIKETPQSISVITRQQLDDFRVLTVNDALSLATGIMVERVETDRNYYSARGFDITNFQVDGIGTPMTFGLTYGDLDLAIYDRLEVLRGANGLLTGNGNPSATINFIRKRPTEAFQTKVDVTLGSWDNKRLDADISGALNADGSVRGRLVVAHQNTNSYLDRYSRERNVAYGIIEANITDNTSLAIGHTYHQNDSTGNNWGSLPLLYADGSKRQYRRSDSTAPNWSYWNVDTNISFAELTHQFKDDWKLKAQLMRKETNSDSRLNYIFGNEDRATGLGLFTWPGMYRTVAEDHTADIYASGPFELAGRKHELVVGATWNKSDVVEKGRAGAGVALSSFESAGSLPLPAFGASTRDADFSIRTTNVYAAAKLNPTEALNITAGGSLLSYKLAGISYGVPQDADDRNKFAPYIGAVYDLNQTHSAYASYTTIYRPQIEVGSDLTPLDPLKGKNYEVGIKSEWFNGKLNSSFALFRTEQENVPLPVGIVGIRVINDGIQATSKGYEFDMSGEVTHHLSVNAGYTRLMSLRDDQNQTINPHIPRHLAHIATVYKVPSVENLRVGASLNWQSDIHAILGGFRYEQGSYATLNLMANYQIDDHWSAAVNLYNVTNEKYLASLKWANFGQGYYAAPINGLATLTWRY